MTVHVDKKTGVIYDDTRPHLGGNIFGGDSRCMDDGVFTYLMNRFKPDSLVDVGCGEGQLMEYFHTKGVRVYGIDGLIENIENASDLVREYMVLHDYTDGVLDPLDADMVISCEFVEHVHKRFAVNYLPQFVYCNTLVFTHAVEDQQGYHHVNCENDPYWINLITSLGMVYLEEETQEARSIVTDGHFWGTVLIFKKKFT
jgi:SAM-dependent methyltransferase